MRNAPLLYNCDYYVVPSSFATPRAGTQRRSAERLAPMQPDKTHNPDAACTFIRYRASSLETELEQIYQIFPQKCVTFIPTFWKRMSLNLGKNDSRKEARCAESRRARKRNNQKWGRERASST